MGTKMTDDQMWNDEREIRSLEIDVPTWINQWITVQDIMAIQQSGCSSGAYMPAVTYHQALQTMNDQGDDVFSYIDDRLGSEALEARGEGLSWAEMASHYLSMAVELWASEVYDRLSEQTIGIGDAE